MPGPTISLLELRDEFSFVRNDANYAEVSKALAPNSVKVVLVRSKKNKGIAGAISETHFLKVCATGIDPVKTFARNKMLTDLLRLRDDTPMDHAAEVIEERDPDAVLVLNEENKFVGYLSPQDFKELQVAQERIGGKKVSGPSTPPPVKGDVSHSLNLGDEFAFVRNDALFSDASRMLAPAHVKVILIRAKKDKGIAGVLTEPEFLKVCATGINPDKTLVSKHMLIDILRIRSDTPLEEAVKIIGERDPDAVLVLNADKKFVGYLSPADYNEAIELLKKKKIEVFDVPAIKPEIAPPPPPPPPPPSPDLDIETTLLDELIEGEERVKISTPTEFASQMGRVLQLHQDQVVEHLKGVLSGGTSGPVIWQEDGSEIIVHTDSLSAIFQDGYVLFTIDMECDQVGRSPMVLAFYIGLKDELTNLVATTEEASSGHPGIVGRWSEPMQDSLWLGLLDLTIEMSGAQDNEAVGIGAGDAHLWVQVLSPSEIENVLTNFDGQLTAVGISGDSSDSLKIKGGA